MSRFSYVQRLAVIDDYYANPRPIAEIAKDHKIGVSTVNEWITEYQEKKHKPKTHRKCD